MLCPPFNTNSLDNIFGVYENPIKVNCELHGIYYQKFSKVKPVCPDCKKLDEEKQTHEIEVFKSHVKKLKKEYQAILDFFDAMITNKLHTGCTFANYNINANNSNLELFMACKEYSKINLNSGTGLLMLGSSGSGKTHLAVALLKKFILKHYITGKYVKFCWLTTISKKQPDYEKLLKCGLLVIDEIGIGDTSYSKDILYQIIDYRYDNMIPTILISNLPSTEFFSNNSIALNSRLNENYMIVNTNCEDYRKNADKVPPIAKETMIKELLSKYDENVIRKANIQ